MADDTVDISGMPDPGTIGLAPQSQADPAAGMPDPKDLYLQHHGYPAQSDEDVANFMRDPDATPDVRKEKSGRFGASALTGIPRAVAGTALAVPAAAASITGQLSGSLGAALDPDNASKYLEKGRERSREWSAKVNNLSDYVPATPAGAQLSSALLSVPGQVGSAVNQGIVRPALGDNASQLVGDIAQDIGTDLPAMGVPGAVRGAGKVAARVARAAKADAAVPEGTSYDSSGNAQPGPPPALPVGDPVTGDTLRAQPNPIPPPDGTVAAERAKSAPSQPPDSQAAATQPRLAAGETAPVGDTTLPATDSAPLDMSLSPDQRALIREGVAARRRASDNAPESTQSPGDAQRGSTTLFDQPKNVGPQETPATPAEQVENTAKLNALDKLSGNALPIRRDSAIAGDYNATGDDWQAAKTGNESAQRQLASESDALHTATDNVHDSVGSLSEDSVDPVTLGDRGRTTRAAIQGIEKHFSDATDNLYDAARAANQGRAMPRPSRVSAYLNDDSNFTNDAEQGLQRAAKQRMERLWTSGDPDSNSPAGSINGAERLREFLNEKGKNPQAMGVASDLKNHLDMDVAEQGGPGLFQTARAMRRHSYQMLEEPVGIKKLLTPGDSQGINHAIPEHKVMDYIADLPREQHEHVMNVLRAGAHLSPELAESSAAAIREIQGHTISRLHDAATDEGGKWNARSFASAATRYARNAESTFKDRPDILRNLETVKEAGDVLHMDKSYPGAAAQAARSGILTGAVKGAGAIASSLAHEIPIVGRIVGRGIEGATEAATGDIGKRAAEKAFEKRLVDRNGKQRGSVQLFNDNKLNRENEERTTFHGKDINPRNERNERTANQQIGGQRPLTDEQNDILRRLSGEPLGARIGGGKQRGAFGDLSQRDSVVHEKDTRGDITHHRYSVPGNELGPGGQMHVTEYPERGISQVSTSRIVPSNRGQGWGTRMLQRAADDAHARGQVLHSDAQVSDGAAGAYSNLKKLGYDVQMKPNDHVQGAYHSVGDHVFEVRPPSSPAARGKINVPASQRGSFSFQNDNKLNRKNEEQTSFHGKDISPRNERSERTANQQLGGRRPLTDEQNDVLSRLSGGPSKINVPSSQRGSERIVKRLAK